jgi:ATP-dependent Lon protease
MYYTPVGGDIMFVEASPMPGKGNLVLTGQLGDVMKESAQAAFSYVKSRDFAPNAKIAASNFHVHVPEGAVPKDGPSAGITIAAALASLVSGRPVKPDVSMTGEITLSGRVLPIGGLKEKVIASFRERVKTVIFPKSNLKDLEEVPAEIKAGMRLVPVSHKDEVIDAVLAPVVRSSARARTSARR